MRRILVLLTLVAGLFAAAVPAQAADAGWRGVVVAKDNKRSALVTASANGTVRTVRSPKARSVQIGQRVQVSGSRLADGTFKAAALRVTGRVARARLKAVVVRYQRAQGRLLVSAGGSTFALPRARSVRALASAAGSAPAAGDRIVAAVDVSGGAPVATSVATTGRLGTLEVEGILTRLDATSIELVVARAGNVSLALPAGFVLPAGLKQFDEAKLVVAVGTNGTLTLLAIQGDEAKDRDDDGVDFDEDANRLKVEGTITALSDTSVTIQPGASATTVTCALSSPLTGFAVGQRAEMECAAAASGILMLRKIEQDDDDEVDDDDDTDDTDDDDSDDSDD